MNSSTGTHDQPIEAATADELDRELARRLNLWRRGDLNRADSSQSSRRILSEALIWAGLGVVLWLVTVELLT